MTIMFGSGLGPTLETKNSAQAPLGVAEAQRRMTSLLLARVCMNRSLEPGAEARGPSKAHAVRCGCLHVTQPPLWPHVPLFPFGRKFSTIDLVIILEWEGFLFPFEISLCYIFYEFTVFIYLQTYQFEVFHNILLFVSLCGKNIFFCLYCPKLFERSFFLSSPW